VARRRTTQVGGRSLINPELIGDENPEWTAADTARAVRIDGLPESLQRKLRGRPKSTTTKEMISIRLSAEVLEKFRESGSGWQTRVDTALTDWLKTHSPQTP